jgi:hypothetical protein
MLQNIPGPGESMWIRNPSLLGAFTGCLLTTLAYVIYFSILSTTWSTRHLISVTEDFRSSSPGQQQLVRKILLKVIATSKDNLEDGLHKISTSWGQDTEEWRMAVGTRDLKEVRTAEHVFLAHNCQDFPEGEYMSAAQLFCLLEAVHRSFYADYQWFFIATEPIYVSVYQLERHLSRLDSDAEVIYMGRPRVKNSYCIGESGLVLSHRALREIVPLLKNCGTVNASQLGTGAPKGDFALGTCFAKLQKTCYEANVSYPLAFWEFRISWVA